MTIAQKVGQLSAQRDQQQAANQFAMLAKHLMRNRGVLSEAIQAAHSGKVADIPGLAVSTRDILKASAGSREISRATLQKAAVAAGTLTDGAFADYSNIASGFVSSLSAYGVFDRILADAVPVPVATGSVGAVSVASQAFSVSEGSVKPVGRLSITGAHQNPTKAHAIVVTSNELARHSSPAALQFILRALRIAVAVTTDAAFISAITSGVTPGTASGETSAAIRLDIKNLLRSVLPGQGSSLYIITTPQICEAWCMTDGAGGGAFPQLGPMGGSINGIPVLVSDGVASAQGQAIILVDAAGIAAGSGDVALSQMQDGVLQMSDTPDSPSTASTSLVSLWQNNLTAAVVERWMVASRIRENAVAVSSYGNSPP